VCCWRVKTKMLGTTNQISSDSSTSKSPSHFVLWVRISLRFDPRFVIDQDLERVFKGTRYSLQAFSSDWSLQSNLSLQKSSLSIHSPLPHDNFPSGHTGSSVLRIGSTFLGSVDQHCAAVICWVMSQ
jgi:hypothetical protein